MTTAFITWLGVAILSALVLLPGFFMALLRFMLAHRFVEIGFERDIFYVPGDVEVPASSDYYDEDF